MPRAGADHDRRGGEPRDPPAPPAQGEDRAAPAATPTGARVAGPAGPGLRASHDTPADTAMSSVAAMASCGSEKVNEREVANVMLWAVEKQLQSIKSKTVSCTRKLSRPYDYKTVLVE